MIKVYIMKKVEEKLASGKYFHEMETVGKYPKEAMLSVM